MHTYCEPATETNNPKTVTRELKKMFVLAQRITKSSSTCTVVTRETEVVRTAANQRRMEKKSKRNVQSTYAAACTVESGA
jgi:hypothetical protein